MVKLNEYSQKIKSTAQKLLDETNLIQILSKYGQVMIGGSFKYDLMWGPDIDIVVLCDDTRKASLSALEELLDLRLFQKYEYGDFVKFSRDGRPRSYIMPLILPFDGQKWEVEVWFFEDYPSSQLEIDNLVTDNITDDLKRIILSMKKQREELCETKHKISSTDIYKKVLLDGVTDYSQLY
jgi:hypothetical protein